MRVISQLSHLNDRISSLPFLQRQFGSDAKWIVPACELLIATGLATFCYCWVSVWRFNNIVRIGVPVEEVTRAYGEPSRILRDGDTLNGWSTIKTRVVTGEVRTYRILPFIFQIDHVVTFENGAVTKVEIGSN